MSFCGGRVRVLQGYPGQWFYCTIINNPDKKRVNKLYWRKNSLVVQAVVETLGLIFINYHEERQMLNYSEWVLQKWQVLWVPWGATACSVSFTSRGQWLPLLIELINNNVPHLYRDCYTRLACSSMHQLTQKVTLCKGANVFIIIHPSWSESSFI